MGNHSSAAAVIDLQEFRAQRARRGPSEQKPAMPPVVPVLVWLMVWPTTG
jgi:hypothetical protein